MTGLDSAIASLLASRTELLMSAIRAPGGVSGSGVTGTSVGQTTQPDMPQTVGAPAVAAGPAASAQTELSSVARTLDVISRFGGATPALTGDTPLWPTPPRPASAFAALTTGLFDTAFSSNAAAVAAARAATQNLPPLPAAALATALARTVGESGLFYESHLVQWLAGQRSAASLGNEPQARVDARSMSLPFELANAVTPADTGLDDARAPQLAPDLPDFHGRPIATPQTPQQAAALAASVRDASPSELSNSQNGTANGANAQTAQPSRHESALQASLAAGIHPATLNVVRQQLDVLANEQFRWQGEAWPGTRFEWEVAREPRDQRASDDAADERAWRTRITLSLPALGTVDAELVLSGDKLVTRIKAGDAGARRLAADGAAFARQLEAAGIALASLSVRSMDGTTDLALSGDKTAAKKPVRSPLEHLFHPPHGDGSET
ncbi:MULTISPECIES: flagellar hook-length control protein FliK [unclassified Caballeronia]|uniref:flagellar hook-length control protein FliK n=1 Tax=unclassified Caballeronia TaxID=2646786 RepID=UPI0020291A69|nr:MULTISPECIES: flagellar hook-length control protein FliK [unclassified Caballeronia]MDR5786131.1 flagellar hook-length control protein FliK [Caballeronia sp. LP003]